METIAHMCTKICKGPCGLELPATTEYFNEKTWTGKNGKYTCLIGKCKSCRRIEDRKYYRENSNKCLSNYKRYLKTDKGKASKKRQIEKRKESGVELARCRKYAEKNREKIKSQARERCLNLTDTYVKAKITKTTGIPVKDIKNNELIILKRNQLILHRTLKTISNEQARNE